MLNDGNVFRDSCLCTLESIDIMTSKPDPFSYSSLLNAAFECTKNVAWKESVAKWMSDVQMNVLQLKSELDSGTYKLSDPYVFHITDPKPRTVSAVNFRDRVVQRSLCNCVLYDVLTKGLIYDNCACQKGKGVTFAIDRLTEHMHRYFRENHAAEGHIVRLDIRKYFPSIPHELLKKSLMKLDLDNRVRDLLFMIIDDSVKIKSDDDISFNDSGFGIRGIGLGSQISQLMALHYLSSLDHFLKERLRVKHYLRYMDDMIMIVKTEDEAKKLYHAVEDFIQPLGLKLNPKSKIVRLDQPFEFLKMIYKLTEMGTVKQRIVRRAVCKEIRECNKLCRMLKAQTAPVTKLIEHTNTWFGYAKNRASRNQIRYIRKLYASNLKDFKKVTIAIE